MNTVKAVLSIGIALVCALFYQEARAEVPATPFALNIPEQPLQDALNSFAQQTGLQVIFPVPEVEGATAPKLEGRYTAQAALNLLLAGTRLSFEFMDERTVAIRSAASGVSQSSPARGQTTAALRLVQSGTAAQTMPPRATDDAPEESARGVPEILVKGSKILNMDIRRSRDDAQPYVIFDREKIEASGAVSLEDFLKTRLTMNTQAGSNNQQPVVFGNQSQINLRGLGTNQTLILVDGHRTASPLNTGGNSTQADVNGIPLSAVERIEVLPTTASGIYGGSATGGVVNIILRRDYAGAEAKVSYENTVDGDAPIRRVEFNTGFNLEEGRTNVLLAASWTDDAGLRIGERDFLRRARAEIMANNPGFLTSAANPPLGATTNIRSANGSPLFGPGTSNFTSVPAGAGGIPTLAALQANAGRYNLESADTAQLESAGRFGLLNATTVGAVTATVRRQFTPSLQAFIELNATNNEGAFRFSGISGRYTLAATAPNNPFGQAINVTVPIDSTNAILDTSNRDRRVVAGLVMKLPREWMAEVDYTWDRFSTWYASSNVLSGAEAPLIANGTLNVLRDLSAFPIDFSGYEVRGQYLEGPLYSTLRDSAVRFAGPAFSLPAGSVRIASLLEHRREFFAEGRLISTGTAPLYPSRSQTIDSAYVEARLPLTKALELQVAGRHDIYAVDGATNSVSGSAVVERVENRAASTHPTVALRFQPTPDLTLRASYGTGFRPPAANQLIPNAPVANSPGSSFVDPRRGNTPLGTITVLSGGNPGLRAEQSESASVGVVLTPRFASALRMSLDYARIRKTDNITVIGGQQAIDYESVLPDRIVRAASAPGDPYGVGPIVLINQTSVNIARAELESFDMALDYALELPRGAVDLFAAATWQPHYRTQLTPTEAMIENAGVSNANPIKFKGNFGGTWRYGAWTLGSSVQYFDSYRVSTNAVTVLNQGGKEVDSQTYCDVFGGYRFARGGPSARGVQSWLSGVEIQGGIKNVFNTQPPFDAGALRVFYSPFGNPRLSSYYLSLKRSFP